LPLLLCLTTKISGPPD